MKISNLSKFEEYLLSILSKILLVSITMVCVLDSLDIDIQWYCDTQNANLQTNIDPFTNPIAFLGLCLTVYILLEYYSYFGDEN